MHKVDSTSSNSTPVIVSCNVGKTPENMFGPMPEITVVLTGGKNDSLGTYYPDEITFTASEFIGKTMTEAREHKRLKDVAFLRS